MGLASTMIMPRRLAFIDRSGAITAGGVAQELAAANQNRCWLFIQNISAEELWIDFGSEAVADQPSIKIAAGGNAEFGPLIVSPQAVSIIGATTGSAFTAKET